VSTEALKAVRVPDEPTLVGSDNISVSEPISDSAPFPKKRKASASRVNVSTKNSVVPPSTGRILLNVQNKLLTLTDRIVTLENENRERDGEERHIVLSMDHLRETQAHKLNALDNHVSEEVMALADKMNSLESIVQDNQTFFLVLAKVMLSFRLGLSKMQLDTQHFCNMPIGSPADIVTPHSSAFLRLLKLLHDDVSGCKPLTLPVMKSELPNLVQPDDRRPLNSTLGSLRVAIEKQVNHHLRGNSKSLEQERDVLLGRVREIAAVLKARKMAHEF